MAWSTPPSFVAGNVLTAAQLNVLVADLAALAGAWTAYVPAITTGGSAITLGNGTLDAAYKVVGDKTTHWRCTLVVGSTTVLPAGAFSIPLPTTALAADRNAGVLVSKSPNRQGIWRNDSTTTVVPYENGTSAIATVASLGTVSGTTLIFSGTYEGA